MSRSAQAGSGSITPVGPSGGGGRWRGVAETIMHAAHEPLLILDGDLKVWQANAAFYRAFHLAPSEAEGRPITELSGGAWNTSSLPELLRRTFECGSVLESRQIEGQFGAAGRKTLLVNARRIDRQEGHQSILLAVEDLTRRRDAERMGRATEQMHRDMMQSLPVAVYTCDLAGRIMFYNRAAADLWGQEPKPGDLWCGSWRIFHPDGRPMTLDECPMAITLREGRPVRGREVIVERPDGSRRFVLPFPDPIRDGAGGVVGATNTLLDLTEQKAAEGQIRRHRDDLDRLVRERTAELESVHNRLRLAERMASIGALSAGLGHDISNLILPLRIRLESLGAVLPTAMQEDIKAIKAATEYLQRLGNGLRLLSGDPGRARPDETTELGAWWNDAGPMLKSALPRGIVLDVRFAALPCSVRMARAALTQAVFNLVQNAGESIRPRGVGRVTVWAEFKADAVCLGVSDDGQGMSPEVRARCLEPYFTTKPSGVSNGLGLMLVRGMVEDAGGTVEVQSEPGNGTTVIMRLRAAGKAEEPPPAPRPAQARVTLRDPRLRSLVASELRSMACDVRLGADDVGPEADLLVVDQLKTEPSPGGATVVLFSDGDEGHGRDDVISVGPNPKPREIRQALRTAAGRFRR